MLGQAVVVRDFEMTRGGERRPVVLGAVDGAVAQRLVHLAEFHRRGVAAQGFDHRHGHVGILHPDAHSVQVLRTRNRLLGRIHRPLAGIVEGQADQAVGLHRRQDLLADRAVQHPVVVLAGAEDERQRQHRRLFDDVVQHRQVQAVEVDGAEHGLLQRVAFLAKLGARVHLDAEAAAGQFGEHLAHVFDRLDRRIAVGVNVGGAEEFARLRLLPGRGEQEQQRRGPQHQPDGAAPPPGPLKRPAHDSCAPSR